MYKSTNKKQRSIKIGRLGISWLIIAKVCRSSCRKKNKSKSKHEGNSLNLEDIKVSVYNNNNNNNKKKLEREQIPADVL